MAVTLQQIAEAAGVSRGTVDRALNNRGRIRPEVEERIKRIAREMGYQPSRAGRALAMAKRKIRIGVILQYMETPFMQQVLNGVLEAKEEVESFGGTVKIYPHEGSSVPVCSPAQYQMQPPSSGLHILSLPEPGQIPRKIPVFSISTTLFIWAIYPLLTSTAGTVHEEVSDTSTLHLPHHPVVQTGHGIRRLSAES